MIRFVTTTTAVLLALGGPLGSAATAQQADERKGGQAEAQVGAPASAETGVKGVYSVKGMMGIPTTATGAGEGASADESGAASGKKEDESTN